MKNQLALALLAFFSLASVSCGERAEQPPPPPRQSVHSTEQATADSQTAPELDCADWAQLTADERFFVIGSALKAQVGGPRKSPLAACLWSISELIGHHIFVLCSAGGSYPDALGLGLSSAIEYCQDKK